MSYRANLHANRLVPEVVPAAGVRDVDGAANLQPAAVAPTQVRRPWRSTVRTVVQNVLGFAPYAAEIYQAATGHDPATATGLAGAGLATTAAITRVMAIPTVEAFLRRYRLTSWLAAAPGPSRA